MFVDRGRAAGRWCGTTQLAVQVDQQEREDQRATSGYRQVAFDHGASDLAAGENTLAYFTFEDARFGGIVQIPYYDEDGISQGNWELEIK